LAQQKPTHILLHASTESLGRIIAPPIQSQSIFDAIVSFPSSFASQTQTLSVLPSNGKIMVDTKTAVHCGPNCHTGATDRRSAAGEGATRMLDDDVCAVGAPVAPLDI
jgi:hypothetical protein